MLDVAVREAKDQDRRRRDKDTLLLSSTQAVRLDRRNSVDGRCPGLIETLDVQGCDGASCDTRDGPEDAAEANLFADRRRSALSHAVLVVPVGENDHERPCLYGTPPRSIFTACPSWPGVNAGGFRTHETRYHPDPGEAPRPGLGGEAVDGGLARYAGLFPLLLLHETLPHAPLVLGEQHAAELGQTVRRIVERPNDLFPLRDRQRHDLRLSVVGGLKPLAVASNPALRSRRASSSTSRSVTGMPASIIASTLSEQLFACKR